MYKKIILLSLISLVLFSSNVVVAQNKTDKQGRKQGEWIKKNKQGKIIQKGTYKDDYPIDTFYYYDKNGKLEIKNFFSDKGTKTNSKFFYPNGKIKAEGNYLNKKKEGTWVYYNPKGIKITEENYKQGLKEGIEKNWDNDGKNIIQTTNYKNGKKNGSYYQSLYGEGSYTASYTDDVLDGKYVEYYSPKGIKIKGLYQKGLKQDVWQVFTRAGNLCQKLFYKNDTLTSDVIIFSVEDNLMEIPSKEIAVFMSKGKQSELIMMDGKHIEVMNPIEYIVPLTDENVFVCLNQKTNIYVNTNILVGINANGTPKLNRDIDININPDKDGKEFLNTLFRND